jgi:enolase
MSKIKEVVALEVLDSRGDPTVEVSIKTSKYLGRAIVPSGASTGKHEALELRDHDKRFLGKGVRKAVNNVNKKLAPKLKNKNSKKQQQIDELLQELDGTYNKKKLGANAILGVSLACAVVAAGKKPLYKHLQHLGKKYLYLKKRKLTLPKAFFNIINGGKHADNSLAFQEFMIVPQFNKFSDNLKAASEVYHTLQKLLHKKYGKGSTNVGNEGGFAPNMKTTPEALKLLVQAINKAGYKGKVKIAIDAAASEFYSKGKYKVDKKLMSKSKLLNYYLQLINKFPIISLEDPFHEDDFESFAELTKKTKIQIVADDLTVTHPFRIHKAVENKSANCLLLKVNQIGTLSEALEAADLAMKHKWQVMVSHRSGETEDTFIADLAVALGCGMIKAGAPARGERTAKYNRLLRIEKELLRGVTK